MVPTLRSFTSNIFKPQAVKHSWDFLNLILVLFAVVCGFLTKNDNNETQTPRFDQRTFSNPETPSLWYENSNRSFNRLRSFGSYPDLRQHSLLVTGDERYRFYDDTRIHFRYKYPRFEDEELHRETVSSGEVYRSPMWQPENKPPSDSRIEDIGRNVERTHQVETNEKLEINDFVGESSEPPVPESLPAVRKKKNRIGSKESLAVTSEDFSASPVLQPELIPQPPCSTDQSSESLRTARKKKSMIVSKENVVSVASEEFLASPVLLPEVDPQPPSFTTPPPLTRAKAVRRNVKRTYQPEQNDVVAENSQLPPSPPLPADRKVHILVKKKRGNVTKEFLTSLRGKKKKQRQKSVENFETILNSQSQPPPPPPPPPPSVFHNLFSSNKSKHKKHYLVPMAPPKRDHSQYRLKDNVNVMNSGNESPLIPIPPPPPPPPFKLPAWKFRVQGDFVRVDSIGSSRSGSPDSDEIAESPISPYAPNGEEFASETANSSGASLFCPSPDVDTKAHNFIQNFRAGLRMAKMNSMKEKHGIGRSNLGPLPNSLN